MAAAEQAYTLYPNPNNGSFILKQKEAQNKNVSIKVYSAIGVLLYQYRGTFVNGSMPVAMGQRAQGLYLVCIGDENERTPV